MAGLAVGELARKASGTLVTADPRHPLLADTVTSHPVALGRLNATPITVTGWKEGKGRGKGKGLLMMFALTALGPLSFIYILMLQTSALGPRVSPVVLLTVCAGLPSKAVTTLTLASEL